MSKQSDDDLYGPAMTKAEARKARQQAMDAAKLLADSAVDYQAAQHEKGYQCSAADAVAQVGRAASSPAAPLSTKLQEPRPRFMVAALGVHGHMRELPANWAPGDAVA